MPQLGPAKVIRQHCWECSGGPKDPDDKCYDISYRASTRKCTARACKLWPWRFGIKPSAAQDRGYDVVP